MMKLWTRSCIAAVAALLALAGSVSAQGVDPPEPSISAEEVQAAIKSGVAHLYAIQTERGDWEEVARREDYEKGDAAQAGRKKLEYGGRTALAVLALLYAGEEPQTEKLAKAIKFLSEVEITGTYSAGIRSSVWAKLHDPKVKPLLQIDANFLMKAAAKADNTILGDFSYGAPHPGYADYSNSQYGVLGLREASIRGVEVPLKFWEAVEKNMITNQAVTGGWGYHRAAKPEDTYGNMTMACLANLYITLDRLQLTFEGRFTGTEAKGCGRRKAPEAIAKALEWMDRNLPVDMGLKQGGDPQVYRAHGMGSYYLYGLERCGNASGRKTFGGINWFEEGAKFIISKGGPRGDVTNTSWMVLFLSKGNAPVFYNKLDTGTDDWSNDQRDVPNLSDYIGDQLEQRINWQVVDLKDSVEQWLDAPCLFINGHDPLKLNTEQKQKLRLYTDSGGTLVAEACCSKPEFIKSFRQLAVEVWPEWELQILDRKHPVFEFHHKITGKGPKVMHIDDGCRSRVFFIMEDMSCAWTQNLQSGYGHYFQFGMNLARYASDKRRLRSRLFYPKGVLKELAEQGKEFVRAEGLAASAIAVGDWSTEGRRLTDIRGLRHLAETLKEADELTMTVVPVNGATLEELDKVQVLHLSGHHSISISDDKIAKLQAFMKRGGLIWVDPQCGREAFKTSFAELLKKLLPAAQLTAVAADDPLMTGVGLPLTGFDLKKIRYKQAMQLREVSAVLQEVKQDGKRVLIYSPYDITCGLDGHDCALCLGPERNDALKIASNIVLSAVAAGNAEGKKSEAGEKTEGAGEKTDGPGAKTDVPWQKPEGAAEKNGDAGESTETPAAQPNFLPAYR